MIKGKPILILIILTLLTSMVSACEKAAPFEIKNETSISLFIVVVATDTSYTSGEGVKPECQIEPGQICRPKHFFANTNTFLIEAKDGQGNVVFSKLFSNQELRDMHWEVTISPP